jgi:polyphosphate kinase
MKDKKILKTDLYLDRDIDWLAFNERVLQEAEDDLNPIYERLKFLAIFSSNLDEFFKVRVSKLRQIAKVKKKYRKPLALKPNKLLKEILVKVNAQQERFGKVFREQIKPVLSKLNIYILEIEDFSESQQLFSKSYFKEKIAPSVKRLNNDEISASSFEDGALYLALKFKDIEALHFVTIPSKTLGRFHKMPSENAFYCYAFLEDLIKVNADLLFPEFQLESRYVIKLSKDAELYLDDDYEGEWIQQIYDSLSKRQTGQATRLLCEVGMPTEIKKQIRKRLGLGKVDMVAGGRHHNFSDFFSFPNPMDNPKLFFKPFPALMHKALSASKDMFKCIKDNDQILHLPYQSFSHLEDWVTQASEDTSVVSIQISLYRIAKDSRLTTAILKALENKKKVSIFVEAKARFDEENNLKWGKIFEEKGAEVFYSFQNIKVHSKILLIRRLEKNKAIDYAYIGTGNFNAKTAKIYGDHGLFTANKSITKDLVKVFNVLKREVVQPKFKTLLVSPFNNRSSLNDLIQFEIDSALKGLPSGITLKMNALEDQQMIDRLYEASNAGVKIKLLIRGFCRLKPNVPNLSENITLISIVDRFLEHSRIFIFHNQGSEKMFVGSADWMTRNLDKRIEVLTPILDAKVFQELKHILHLQLNDTVKARMRDALDNNRYVKQTEENPTIRSQYAIYEYLKTQ